MSRASRIARVASRLPPENRGPKARVRPCVLSTADEVASDSQDLAFVTFCAASLPSPPRKAESICPIPATWPRADTWHSIAAFASDTA